MIPEKLAELAKKVHESDAQPQETVRTLLTWFGAKRRGFYVVIAIREALESAKLVTSPDFSNAYIDAAVRFLPAPQPEDDAAGEEGGGADGGAGVVEAEADAVVVEYVTGAVDDPTFRVGQLPSANIVPQSVVPTASLEQATTIMMVNDYSQLPVMQGDRDVKGVVSWESIGKRRALGQECVTVRDCMETHVPEVAFDRSLFSAIDLIVRHGYVLVRQIDKRVTGIITTSDLSLQFHQLAEPFLLVGEIENYVRRLIDSKFTKEQLATVKEPADERPIESVADLTFGQYVRLLENPAHWESLHLPVDRTIFIQKLDRVRELRNDVMHFDPDPFPVEDLNILRLFASFMRSLVPKGKAAVQPNA